MKWIEDVIARLDSRDGFRQAEMLLAGGLAGVKDLGELKDILGAGSILLHAAALGGDLVFPSLGRALEALDALRGPDAENAVIGLGDAGRGVLGLLSALREPGIVPRGFYIELESSRVRDAGEKTVQILLDAAGEGESSGVPRYGDLLRAAYRAAAGVGKPPALLAENLLASPDSRVTVHVIAGLEDPWVAVISDLLLDLRSFLGRGTRGRAVLHLVTRPSPRVKGGFRAAMEDLERTRPFDEAFVVCASEEVLARKVLEFIQLTTRAPELLLHHGIGPRGGAFSSYGVARAPAPVAGEPHDTYIRRLDEAYVAAAPSWVPGNAVLLELTAEQVCFIHPTGSPPPEDAWRLCPDLVPVAVPDGEPVLCRIQRGLRLEDLRLV